MILNKVSFSYKGKTKQLNGISTKIAKGRITTIIGPNGSGKSTLLSVMSRNLMPSHGTVELNGKTIHAYTPKEFARKLAIVEQQNDAPNDLTVEKLIYYGRIPHKRFFASHNENDIAAVDLAIERTNLNNKRNTPFLHLSGGEKQRVWIALALAQQTPMLFLDEPTTYLDMYYQLETLELIKHLNEVDQLTVVMVLHDINQAIRYSDHLIVMKNGQVIVQGKTEEVITKELIKSVYNVNVMIKRDEKTGPYIIPIRE